MRDNELMDTKDNNSKITPQYSGLQEKFNKAFNLMDDVVLKKYISKLDKMDIIPLDDEVLQNNISSNVRLFKINEMVYQQDEYATYKFASVFNAVAATKSTLFIIIDSNGEKTDFYMGIRSTNQENSTKTCYDTLENSIKGQFPGIKTSNIFDEDMKNLFNRIQSNSISAVTGVANSKSKEEKENKFFIQGLEKLVLAMQGERYTGIIIANPTSQDQLSEVRKGYENIYAMISPFANMQVSYGSNSATNLSKSFTEGITEGENTSTNKSKSVSTGTSTGISKSFSESKETASSIAGKSLGTALAVAGAAIGSVVPGIGTIAGGAVGGLIGNIVSSATNRSVTDSNSTTDTRTENISNTIGETFGTSKTTNKGTTDTQAITNGSNENLQLTIQNKSIINSLDRIDKQLERLNEFESLGMWECAAYFLSENSHASEIAAATYKALMRGENSGIEVSAINVWNKREKEKTKLLKDYITNFIHPLFKYNNNGIEIPVTPTALVSGNELAIHMGLPRKSVCGFPVIEHADFGKEIVSYKGKSNNYVNLGKVFNMGIEFNNRVVLDTNSLAMHTFITGSTGAGKSNTVYEIIDQLNTLGIKFFVIEPAKGEYKNVLGHRSDVIVLGTNPKKSKLLKINPFKFSEEIHVLEHIDRLIEIFNVCWPMYAAMPAVLKDAVERAYEECGWDLDSSENRYNDNLYPTFADVLIKLNQVVNESAFSEEVKGNYVGSLVTRVKSLTNGINGRIFSSDEIDNEILFDSNVIVDLSRVGSVETKSMIMGILIMRLQEHRMSQGGMNIPLKHVTVLEEAHNILKKTSTEQPSEGSNLIGKSVEMISNSIAEMRTYGEGFIIADQAPGLLDMSAIRNTNTKIILRLPDKSDRELVGKAAGLNDDQIAELAKLETGVAAVYQNNWLEAVLCKVDRFDSEEKEFIEKEEVSRFNKDLKKTLSKILLSKHVGEKIDYDIDDLEQDIIKSNFVSGLKIEILKTLVETDLSKLKYVSGIVSKLYSKDEAFKFATSTENIEEWNKIVLDNIDPIVYELEEHYRNSILQCLLREKAKEHKELEKFYFGWSDYMRGKVL